MKFGSLKKGWVWKITFHNPNIWSYRKSGRLRVFDFLGIVHVIGIVRRKKEMGKSVENMEGK
jgi:hypothetical protein